MLLPGVAIAEDLEGQSQPGYADLDSLAKDHVWRGLLGFHSGSRQSDVVSPEYFLSSNGRSDPASELEATRVAMMVPVGENPDKHAQCRFPARYLWLKSHHALEGVSDVECPAFQKWIGARKPTGASIIFASGDLSNPATFYGHMMLRLTTGTETTQGSLLENAINNGAIFPEDENGFVYVFRGLTGAYKATYSRTDFYKHLHRYGETQMRDIWEYRLDLTQDQTDLLTAHAYEMVGEFNRYYFLRQNCAYRIADLIGVATDTDLLPEGKAWVMPVDVVDRMVSAQNAGKPLVQSAELLESRKSRLRDKYLSLSSLEQRRVGQFLAAPNQSLDRLVGGLDTNGQARVIETLLDYYSVPEASDETTTPEMRGAQRNLLVARMARPAGRADFGAQPTRLLPHEGQKSALLGVSLGDNSALGQDVQLRLRFAYNDFLSITPGALPYSELSFGDLKLNTDGRHVSLQSLDVVRITTLNLSQTGLPKEGGSMAWRLRGGTERYRIDCNGCLTGIAEANVGKAARLGKWSVGYAMVGARIYGTNPIYGALQGGITTGLIFNTGKAWRTAGEFGLWKGDAGKSAIFSGHIETRVALSRNVDLNLVLQQESDRSRTTNEVRSGLIAYW